jgi:hypothetical protein
VHVLCLIHATDPNSKFAFVASWLLAHLCPYDLAKSRNPRKRSGVFVWGQRVPAPRSLVCVTTESTYRDSVIGPKERDGCRTLASTIPQAQGLSDHLSHPTGSAKPQQRDGGIPYRCSITSTRGFRNVISSEQDKATNAWGSRCLVYLAQKLRPRRLGTIPTHRFKSHRYPVSNPGEGGRSLGLRTGGLVNPWINLRQQSNHGNEWRCYMRGAIRGGSRGPIPPVLSIGAARAGFLYDGVDGNCIGLTDTPPDEHNPLVSQELGGMNLSHLLLHGYVGVSYPFFRSPLTPEAM